MVVDGPTCGVVEYGDAELAVAAALEDGGLSGQMQWHPV